MPKSRRRIPKNHLLHLVGQIRVARKEGMNDGAFLEEFQSFLPDTDVSNLCDSDYDDETILEICLGEKEAHKLCTRGELLELVRKLQCPEPGQFETEAGAIKACLKFNYNCRHPAKSDLIFYPQEHFGGRSNPTSEEIVEKALRGE